MVNPSRKESVCDPCCGIGDFLSVSFVNSEGKLDDSDLYGFDNDYNMTVLAQLNMLLNGDGNATIKYLSEKGSITQKLNDDGEPVKLDPNFHNGFQRISNQIFIPLDRGTIKVPIPDFGGT